MIEKIQGKAAAMKMEWHESFIDTMVTYSLEIDGQFVLIENVPARINVETGERFFSPHVIQHLQQTIWNQHKPHKVIETPVLSSRHDYQPQSK